MNLEGSVRWASCCSRARGPAQPRTRTFAFRDAPALYG
jgi:hypothetical protein